MTHRVPDFQRYLSSVHPKVHCTAHTTAGRPCRNWSIRGGRVCRAHGGRAPQVKRAAAARLVKARLTLAMEAYVQRCGEERWAAVAMAVEVLGWQLEEVDSVGASAGQELLALWEQRRAGLEPRE